MIKTNSDWDFLQLHFVQFCELQRVKKTNRMLVVACSSSSSGSTTTVVGLVNLQRQGGNHTNCCYLVPLFTLIMIVRTHTHTLGGAAKVCLIYILSIICVVWALLTKQPGKASELNQLSTYCCTHSLLNATTFLSWLKKRGGFSARSVFYHCLAHLNK